MRKELSVPLYARFVGQLEYFCPNCGYLNVREITPKAPWVYRCMSKSCGHHWAFGVTIKKPKHGFKTVPRDRIFPPPQWVLRLWGHEDRINDNETGLPKLKTRAERVKDRAAALESSDVTVIESE